MSYKAWAGGQHAMHGLVEPACIARPHVTENLSFLVPPFETQMLLNPVSFVTYLGKATTHMCKTH